MKTIAKLTLGAILMVSGVSKGDEFVFLGMDGARETDPVNAGASVDYAPMLPSPDPAAQEALTIPAGTQITVRTIDAIDGKTAKGGARYRASIDDPVGVGSRTAIPRGANCTLEVVSIESGEGMALRLRDVNVAGKVYSTSTQYAEVDAKGTSKSKKAVRRGVGLGALGAGIGAIAGGGSGAAIGAVVGGSVGALSAAGAKGKEINVPSETRLIFALTAPVPMN
jgi:hypothetical protein